MVLKEASRMTIYFDLLAFDLDSAIHHWRRIKSVTEPEVKTFSSVVYTRYCKQTKRSHYQDHVYSVTCINYILSPIAIHISPCHTHIIMPTSSCPPYHPLYYPPYHPSHPFHIFLYELLIFNIYVTWLIIKGKDVMIGQYIDDVEFVNGHVPR